jgi:hypothetical protein
MFFFSSASGKHKNETVTASVTVAELPTTQVPHANLIILFKYGINQGCGSGLV